MPVVPVADLDDDRLAIYRQLKTSNLTRGTRLFVAEGIKVVERLLASDCRVVSVLAGESYLDKILPSVPDDVVVYAIPTPAISQLVGFQFHRGVLACAERPVGVELEEFLAKRSDGPLRLTICPDVTDPENLGGIVRTSAAFGVDAVVLGPTSARPFSRRVLRTSMGTVFRIPVVDVEDLPAALRLLKFAGVELLATVLDPDAEPLDEARRGPRFGLLFGNEGHGLARSLVELCDRRVTLPMHGGTDSLNVTTAAGVFWYHFTR